MQVAEVKISPSKARAKWLEYKRAVDARRNAEDEALRKAYRHLSHGKRVLCLHQVMHEAGVDDKLRPRFAIARCHWEYCHVYRAGSRDIETLFTPDRESWVRSNRLVSRGHFRISGNTLGAPPRLDVRARAPLPHIPPEFRPKGNLDRYCILWEAEWQNVPHDPILLSPLGADLYLVCAQWDLTPLERAVLFQKV